jgi:hypothetical protein
LTAGGLTHPTFFEHHHCRRFFYFEGVRPWMRPSSKRDWRRRLDATNVVHPAVSVITSISRDHYQCAGEHDRRNRAGKGGYYQARRSGGGFPQADP